MFNAQIFTTSLGNVRLHNCLGPPESRNSRSGGRRQGIADSNRARRGTRRALRILSYLGWRDACINRFNRGCMSTISIVVNFCVVRVVEFLRNPKPFQSLLASQRVLQCLLLRFFLAEIRHSLTILLHVLFELLRTLPSFRHVYRPFNVHKRRRIDICALIDLTTQSLHVYKLLCTGVQIKKKGLFQERAAPSEASASEVKISAVLFCSSSVPLFL